MKTLFFTDVTIICIFSESRLIVDMLQFQKCIRLTTLIGVFLTIPAYVSALLIFQIHLKTRTVTE